MSEYTISVGGPKDGDADEYENQSELDVTQSTSSVDTWSATLATGEFADGLLEPIWIYHTGSSGSDDVIFRGELESYETDYTTGMTTISGRGPLVRLDREVISRTYDNTTAYDALVELWGETEFDALVSPPNSDIFDETYVVEWEHRSLYGWLGDSDSAIVTDGVDVDRNELRFLEPNILLDDSDSDGNQNPSIYLDQDTDRIWLRFETTDAVPWIRAGMRQHEGAFGEGTIETVTQTNNYETPQRVHIFDFEFSGEHDTYRPIVETGEYTTSIPRSDVLVADQSDFAELDDVELDGTILDVLKELHDLASYEFTISDYEDLDVRSFPKGTVLPEPELTVIDATRKRSFTDYANKVTAQGGRDGGTAPTATASDQDEIDLMQSMGVGDDGVIERYEKDPELTTQSAVQDRANRLLDESIAERDEGGSLEVAPTFVPVGYTYNVSVWGTAFPYGGKIGTNALYFDGEAYIDWSWGGSSVGSGDPDFGDETTFEAIIAPHQLESMGDNDYQTILDIESEDTGSQRWAVRVYGDGSIGVGIDDDGLLDRTGPHLINNQEAHRLSVQWNNGGERRRVIVDGELEFDVEGGFTDGFVWDDANFRVGADQDGNNGFVGGIDDVRMWADHGYRDVEWIYEYARSDLVTEQVAFDQLVFYFRFDDRIGGIDNMGVTTGVSVTNTGATYDESFGQLDEVNYALGSGETISLDFDVSGRVDTELIDTRRRSRSTRRQL